MTDEHERYEQLAVGHVLGGLGAGDAAVFRSHLLGCRHCRGRVAELREIAADLAAAERDERAQARVRTAAPRRADLDEPDPPPRAGGTRNLTALVVLAAALVGALAFWNLHLRTTASSYAGVADARGDTLRGLVSGVAVEAEVEAAAAARVVADGDEVAFSLADLEPLAADELLVVWLEDTPEGTEAVLVVRADQVDDDAVAATVAQRDAAELVVARETVGELGSAPSDDEVLRADLDAPLGGGR